MTKPAPISHTAAVAKFHKIGIWALLVIILGAVIVDRVFVYHLQLAKALVAGALLSYIMQSVFTVIAHRWRYYNKGRVRASSQMMNDMYLAVLAKWGVGIVGFLFIFIALKGIVLWAVFVGFLLMQVVIALFLYHLGKQI